MFFCEPQPQKSNVKKKIIDNIEDSKNAPFHRVLFALGIRFVGEATAKYLAEHFRSLDAIRQATREQLTEAEEVGSKIADAIIDYFVDKNNIAIIENLRIAGLQFEAEEKAKTSDVLAGLTFVISGSFTNHSRDELKTLIEAHGGKNLAAVSATTSYLLAGDKIGPAKLHKANKLGINIISEDEFIAMIGNNDTFATQPSASSVLENTPKEVVKKIDNNQAIQGTLF